MKFRSPTDQPVHIALVTGHTAIVSPEGNELQAIFHKEAIARGCLPEGVQPDAPPAPPEFDRKRVISDAMRAMLAGKDEADFRSDGKPDLRKLNARVGFTVARDEADALFEEVTADN